MSSISSSSPIKTITPEKFQEGFTKVKIADKTDAFSQQLANLPPFISTNEKCEKTLTTMQKQPIKGNVLIAVSGFFGLDIASRRGVDTKEKLDYLVFIDCSKRVELFWKTMEKIICTHSSREEALNEINESIYEHAENAGTSASYFTPVKDSYSFYMTCTMDLTAKVEDGSSWLSSDDKYTRIREIFLRKAFVFKRINLFEKEEVAQLSQTLTKLNLTIDTLYVSNVAEAAEKDGKLQAFREALACLQKNSTEDTMLIDTKPRQNGNTCKDPAEQQVRKKFATANLKIALPGSPTTAESKKNQK